MQGITMDKILEFKNVNAGYGKEQILNNLSFYVEKGQVFGIIGPNGSGKTTMFNTLLGQIKPSAGTILFDGADITRASANARCRMGLGRTFQVPRPFESMSLYENVLTAAVHGGSQSEHAARDTALECLKMAGLYDKRESRAGELTLLERNRLEIARALGTRPTLLLLDEVAAGLTELEVAEMMELVAQLKANHYTIIWIEHIIETMVGSTDYLMCMAQGSCAVQGKPRSVIESKEVQRLYLGVDDDE